MPLNVMNHIVFPDFHCPKCSIKLHSDPERNAVCPECDYRIVRKPLTGNNNHRYLYEALNDITNDFTPRNDRIKLAYRFYSIVYGPLALLSLYLIWNGRIRPVVKWYRDAYSQTTDRTVVDIAVGDGALTRMGAGPVIDKTAPLLIDLSGSMLTKATVKLKKMADAAFLVANAEHIPLPDNSVDHVFCFGGIHVFSNRQACFDSISRILKPGGKFTGSIVMQPNAGWARRFCSGFLRDLGVLTHTPAYSEIAAEFSKAQFDFEKIKWNGRMMLFEASKST